MAVVWPSASFRTIFCSSREEIGSFGAFGLAGAALIKDSPFWPFSRPQILDLGFPSLIFASCTKKDDVSMTSASGTLYG